MHQHKPIPELSDRARTRFLRRVNVAAPEECWPFRSKSDLQAEYGTFFFNGRIYRAHRIAYVLAYGPIAEDALICHHCDNPPCVNPAHLFLGTHADNTADSMKKGRRPVAIHIPPKSQPMKPSEILELMRLRGWSQVQLATELEVKESTVSKWLNNENPPSGPARILIRLWLVQAREEAKKQPA
jgi:DNA-binding transcriptional regulator YiaG